MKLILILIFTIFSLNSFAENWISISELGTNQAHQMKSDCERNGQECFDLGNLPQDIYSVKTIQVDDTSKPIYSKEDVQACTDLTDCDDKFLALVCTDSTSSKIKNIDLLQVYCSKITGNYEQKNKNIISLDNDKKASYDADLLAKANNAAEELKIQTALKKIDCGKRVIAKLVVLNSTKSLTTAQVATMNGSYSTIKTLLDTGSLETAREQIQNTVADGTLILESDKTALVSTLDACK